MPYSLKEGKKDVRNYVLKKQYKRILDAGCGCGTYGELFKTDDVYMIGLDVIDYTKKFKNLKKYYRDLVFTDIRNIEFIKSFGQFDCIILGDIVEHLSVEDAQNVIESLKEQANALIVAVPYEYPQHDDTNPYENHIQDDLTYNLFMKRYKEFYSLKQCVDSDGHKYYGYFVWERGEK